MKRSAALRGFLPIRRPSRRRLSRGVRHRGLVGSKAAKLPADVSRFVDDADRLAVLHGLDVMDTANDPDFDRIGGLAAAILEAPIALVTLVDIDRQWFKSRL